MAEVALNDGDTDACLEYMSRAVALAEKHDTLPPIVEANSLL